MATKQMVVMGVFDEVADAERAISGMTALGVPRDRIAILAHPGRFQGYGRPMRSAEPHSGAMLSTAGMVATLVGIALCAIPLAGLLTAPPLVLLGGAAVVAEKSFGPDLLEELGVPRADAKLGVEAVRRGSIVVIARVDERLARRIGDVMFSARSIDLKARAAEWEREGWTWEPNAPMWPLERIEEDRAQRAHA